MKLSFDRPATRKLELWATALGIDIDDLTMIAFEVTKLVDKELDKIRQPEQKGEGK